MKRYREITPHSGTSPSFGKAEIVNFVEQHFPDKSISILDVGPGRGAYCKLLQGQGYQSIDAVEIYLPYIEFFRLQRLYRRVVHANIINYRYDDYDLILFGDVVEHLAVPDAQLAIGYAKLHCKMVVVSVPYLSPQTGCQLDGSGDHRQPDLTRETFLERYKDFSVLIDNEYRGVFYWQSLGKR